ncbi:MAG: hypothetical protein WA323_29090, partial [Candidatus Nitrosopolaris sp.]
MTAIIRKMKPAPITYFPYSVQVLLDGERNFESLFGICVLPNIKQRTNAKKGKNRKKAAKIFDASIY